MIYTKLYTIYLLKLKRISGKAVHEARFPGKKVKCKFSDYVVCRFLTKMIFCLIGNAFKSLSEWKGIGKFLCLVFQSTFNFMAINCNGPNTSFTQEARFTSFVLTWEAVLGRNDVLAKFKYRHRNYKSIYLFLCIH